jgi:hypothetical protein
MCNKLLLFQLFYWYNLKRKLLLIFVLALKVNRFVSLVLSTSFTVTNRKSMQYITGSSSVLSILGPMIYSLTNTFKLVGVQIIGL